LENFKEKVIASEHFYQTFFNAFDYKLAEYNFETLKKYFQGALALELGPASGFMTKLLVQEFETLHIIDGSAHLLSQIPESPNLTKHASFFEVFETALRFDTIIMSHVLEHLESPGIVLRKIRAWLDDNGVFIISVPNAKSIHRQVAVEMGLLGSIYELNSRDKEAGHYRVYDMNLLTKDITDAGFTVLDSGGIFLKPLSNGQIDEQWSPEMIEGFYKVGKLFPEYCAEIFIVCKK
jgi:2-polyprenyl-3-methyl-5-hydroxy-6-metoxy-1,4-benzoquinol methylase